MNTDNLALRPNCLMTKHPLVFLTGIRSLFFHEQLGKQLQSFIAAHGYVVLSPALPFRTRLMRKRVLLNWLGEQKYDRFHFILSSQTQKEFFDIFKSYPTSSFTVTDFDLGVHHSINEPLSYKFHRFFCAAFGVATDAYFATLPDKSAAFYDRFLDRCVELAENELI